MSIFHNIKLNEPIIHIAEERFIYSFQYLIQLNNESSSEKNNTDIIWHLTRQLLIAYYMKHQEKESISSDILNNEFNKVLNNEVIEQIIDSQLLHKENLLHMIENEKLEQLWLDKTKSLLLQSLLDNETQIQENYEADEKLIKKNVYEIYEGSFKTEQSNISDINLDKLKLQNCTLNFLGTFNQKELINNLNINPTECNLNLLPLLIWKNKNNYNDFYFIHNFHTQYKMSYESIKEELFEFFLAQELEERWEEFAQELLNSTDLQYINDKIIEQLINLNNELNIL